VAELVYETVKKIEDSDLSRNIRIHMPQDLPLVKTDKLMLQQILYNLISNARVHNSPAVVIHVQATIQAGKLKLVIEDNGSGFPEGEISNVFDKFYRLSNSKPGGTGLGLSIVKGYAEALKGNVFLENLALGGSRFTVEIPAETSYLKV